jgi:hypothetical protein
LSLTPFLSGWFAETDRGQQTSDDFFTECIPDYVIIISLFFGQCQKQLEIVDLQVGDSCVHPPGFRHERGSVGSGKR